MGLIRQLGDFWSILYTKGSSEELCGETIEGENLRRADLTQKNLCSTKFVDCDLRGANFDGATFDSRTSFQRCKFDDHMRIWLDNKLADIKAAQHAQDLRLKGV